MHGGLGIDNVYGDDGDDQVFGDAGSNSTATAIQAGQRLFGGRCRDELFAFAPLVIDIAQFNDTASVSGDQIFGGGDGDFIHGNIRREVLSAKVATMLSPGTSSSERPI